MSSEKVPSDLSAERALLGSMIMDADARMLALPLVKEEDFYLPEHQTIFRGICKLFDENQPADVKLLTAQLRKLGMSQDKYSTLLADILRSVGSTSNAEYYANLVRESHLRRKLLMIGHEIISAASDAGIETKAAIDEAEQNIFTLTEDRIKKGPEQIGPNVSTIIHRLVNGGPAVSGGLGTCYTQLDCILCGLMPSELIIIAGRPSMGKTAFGLNIAENMAVQEGIPVGFFSCEMSKDAVSIRLICSRAKVAGDHIKRGTLSEDDKSRLMLADEVLSAAPIYVDDASGMTLMEVRAKARLLVMRQGIRAAFVDYLQLLRCPGMESRLQEVSEIARGLKAMAKELEIPVIAMAQLNRGVEGREDHKPRMSDLRESGSIEQEADVIMLIHRDEYYQQQNIDVQGKAEIIIAKNRNGSIGTVELQYSKQHTRFNNLGF